MNENSKLILKEMDKQFKEIWNAAIEAAAMKADNWPNWYQDEIRKLKK